MRYGRQRWKLKGRIEVNSRQSWDGDEMVFLPLVSDLINIKVLLNSVSLCASKGSKVAAPASSHPQVSRRKPLFSCIVSR